MARSEGLTGAELRKLSIVVGLNTALVPTAITIIVPALPQIAVDLQVDAPTAALNLTLYALISGIQPLISGPLSDRYGRRPLLLGSHLLWGGSSLMCAVAPNIESLVTFRCLQAAGCSSLMVVGMGALGDAYAKTQAGRLPRALATNSQWAIMGLVCAPTIGGAITEWLGWRGVFFFLFIAGGGCGALTYAWLPETLNTAKEERPRMNLCMPLRSLQEGFADRHVAIVSGGVAICHGVMFLNQIITPLSIAHLTANELYVGMSMIPDAIGAMLGASLGSYLTVHKGEAMAIMVGGVAEGAGLLLVGAGMALSCVGGDSSTWSVSQPAGDAAGAAVSTQSVPLCAEVRAWALLLALAANALIGAGLSCNRVGATTYGMKARPGARASLAGATRFAQMLMVSVMVQAGKREPSPSALPSPSTATPKSLVHNHAVGFPFFAVLPW